MNDLYLHIGLHKTGTTHLESVLHRNREALAEAGIGYIRTLDFRRLAAEKWFALLGGAREEEVKLADRLSCSKVLISDENILGVCGWISLRGTHYPRAQGNLRRAVRVIGGGRRVHIWLALRSYPEWLESVYLQTLRRSKFLDFEEHLKRIDLDRLSWPELIRGLRKALPEAELIVWPYEQYSQDGEHVLGFLANELGTDLPRRPAEVANASFGDFARAALTATRGMYRSRQDLARMHRFLKNEFGPERGYGRTALLTGKLRTTLSERYRRDWDEIAGMADPNLRIIPGGPEVVARKGASLMEKLGLVRPK